ncbi:MAG: hypothetical protein RI571_15360 [Roseovarius sp.]|jgi:hypothetical protein|nr:hypothetical protein [Roseovarius sp.]
MNVIIRDLDRTRVHFEAAVARVGEQGATRAFNRALNSEGGKVRTQVRRALRKQTGAKARLINRETRGIRSTFSNLTYTIEARGNHLGLSHFSPRQFSYGVRAKPWGRWQRFEGAFLVGALANNAFVREGRARLPIRKMFGPAIPKEMVQDATRDAFEAAQPDVLAEATRQIARALDT